MLVAIDQMKKRRRNQVRPGARILWIVAMKLMPVKIDGRTGDDHPGHHDHVRVRVDAAVRRVKRPARVDAPPMIIAASVKIPPMMNTYQLARFKRGKAKSFAPIIIGTRKFP
jgi:hypothetical protein